MSNISIPDLPERIPDESSIDPDSTKIVPETEESMVSIEPTPTERNKTNGMKLLTPEN